MKFNVEIDLDWIDEESTIDETIKSQIISNIENRIVRTIEEKVLKSAQEKIDAEIGGLISSNVHALVSDKVSTLMMQPRTSTDKYGNVVRENFTVETMLIEAVESAITKKTLDGDGRHCDTDSYRSSPQYSYFDWFAKKDVPKLVNEKVKAVADQIKKDIEDQIKNNVKTAVADKLTALIVDNSTALSLRSGTPPQ